MRLKQYILNEAQHRNKTISYEETRKLLEKNCSKSIKGSYIYRGVSYYKEHVFIDPKSGKSRKSAYTDNYYTLIMDNCKEWSKYPKRSESIICTTDTNTAEMYGIVYGVFPYDGAKIGVCSERDLWASFSNVELLNAFNRRLKVMFKKIGIPLYDDNIKVFKNSLKLFDNYIKVNNTNIKTIADLYSFDILNNYKGNLWKLLCESFAPEKNNFKLMKASDNLFQYREVWTDSKSIMININSIDKFYDIIDNYR